MGKRYRKRGLDKTARRMVEFLDQHGIEGASALNVGGGIGEIQLSSLLRRGAARAQPRVSHRHTTKRPPPSVARQGSRTGPSAVSTTSPSIQPGSSRPTSSFESEWYGRSSKHFPFEWSGPGE